jgi:hypothetical protein
MIDVMSTGITPMVSVPRPAWDLLVIFVLFERFASNFSRLPKVFSGKGVSI